MTFINSVFVFFAGQGFFLSFLLIQNKKVKSNPWISLLFVAFGLILLYWVLWWEKASDRYIYTSFNIPAELALGPLFYLSIIQSSKKKQLWHLALPILTALLLLPYWLYIVILPGLPQFYKSFLVYSIPNVWPLIWVSLISYLVMSIKFISSKEQLWLLTSYVVFILGSVCYQILMRAQLLVPWFDYALAIFITITFYSAGYYYFVRYKPYAKSLELSSTHSINDVDQVMNSHKDYLKSDLRIEELSRATNIQIRELTHLIKSNGYSGFKEYINKFRVEHAKGLLSSTDLKILAVGLESGFSNKVSFILNFKKHTGMTPNEFRGTESRGQTK